MAEKIKVLVNGCIFILICGMMEFALPILAIGFRAINTAMNRAVICDSGFRAVALISKSSGCQAADHNQRQQHCNDFLHVFFLHFWNFRGGKFR